MDPNAALRMMIEHMAEGERDGALDAMDALRDWLMGGGFLPEEAAQELVSSGRRETVFRITRQVRHRLDEIDAEASQP